LVAFHQEGESRIGIGGTPNPFCEEAVKQQP